MLTDTNHFKLARMSRASTIGTWAFVCFTVIVPLVIALTVPMSWLPPAIVVMCVAIFLLTLSVYRPARFEVSSHGLRIVWPLRTLELSAGDITEVRPVTKDDLGLMYRTFGVGGLFGGFGEYSTEKLGRMNIYISRMDGLVLIERHDSRLILISPDSPEEFVAKLNEAIAT